MNARREGGCQCGAVRYAVEGEPLWVTVCHCKECQRQSGSAFGMTFAVKREAFHLLQGQLKTFTRSSDSGRPVGCAFCPECGTRIYHEPRYVDGVGNLKPGTLDDTSFLEPIAHAWTSSKQRWVAIPEGVKTFDTQP